MAGESARERSLETAGIGMGKVTPHRADICDGPPGISRNLSSRPSSRIRFVSELLQKYQMMPDCPCHCGMLRIGNTELFSCLPHNSGERSVMGVAYERAQMMGDVMVEPACKPAYDGVAGRIVGCSCEDVIHAVVEFIAAFGEVRGVDRMRGLEDQRHSQTDDQMHHHKRSGH